jgi:O-acetyl-ADP-ribose deacetylase (regulator of RNase III)
MIKIQTKVGNLMHVKTGHIVHGCNAQGVMGSGVALAVRQTYPHVYEGYLWQHGQPGGLKLGVAYPELATKDLMIWNAITQGNFGPGIRQTNYDAVATCFEQVNAHLAQGLEGMGNMQPNEVHIPLIGAARGGGNWEIIREIIEQTMDYPVTLWLPDDTVTTR